MSRKKPTTQRFRLKQDLVLADAVFKTANVTNRSFGGPNVELLVSLSPDHTVSMVVDLETVRACPDWFEEIPANAPEPKPAGKVFDDVVEICRRLLTDARAGRLRNIAAAGVGPRGMVTECYSGARRGVYALVGALDSLKSDIKLRHIAGLRTGEGPEE